MPELFHNLEPLKASAFIRGTRWTLLLLGIGYGFIKQKFYLAKETKYRQEIELKKEMRRRRIAEKRQARLAKKDNN